MKKLVAYSSISHMGFVTLGCFIIFAFKFEPQYFQNAVTGVEGAMIQMISHGFISGALFICVGVLYERLHTKLISKYGGVAHTMPVFATLFMIFAMANSGLPGTSGFVGELFVIVSIFKFNYVYALLAGSTLILGATYTLWMYKRVIFGEIKNKDILHFKDITFDEKITLIILATMVIILGIWPSPLIDIIHTSIEHLVYQIMQSKVF
jgi:NADH-quinone oxidoreductase subunit M